jgi:hypothetical protein
MVSIGMVVLGATDMGRAIGFWTRALGYELRDGGAATDWSSLTPPTLPTGVPAARPSALLACAPSAQRPAREAKK